ncbi:helix-turn-helix transcriptional regulator [Sphingomonas sp. LY160]|uniref:helix-turn-helix transcriptional regulator n=1 Tax=Sphingomonas sp. LY160 TaxID=3095342 RepID=UPI002ADEF01B|nr:LuxR C-terminal-related transcriptional regulator [Sphingomonas sp. LY160]MEA1071294.1 LuxR C-terminal-related transcriptional regulator [Sphingomonas sp. LY160]
MQFQTDLRDVFESSPSMVAITLGPEHRIYFANAALREAFDAKLFQDRPAADVIELGGEREEIQAYLDNVFRTGKQLVCYAVPMALRSSDGVLTHAYYDALYHPLTDEEGVVIGVFVEGHDVTHSITAVELELPTHGAVAIPELTKRQQEVLSCLIAGLSGKQIAEELQISIRTVDMHRTSLLRRLGVKTTAQLIGVMARRPELAAMVSAQCGDPDRDERDLVR